ncbi:MAG TPA: PA0069 family radical SAM protein [Planctomycetota bacterium]|nr:PA0069 family radical SAM protein [Planctomycetota bacterium]
MSGAPVGRGAGFDPPTRFQRTTLEPFDVEPCPDADDPSPPRTQFFVDRTKSVLARNDSPDVPFRWSINPYRGCEHGCIYCYARPSHEYLGFSAGVEFETKILVKPDAPEILAETLASPNWTGEYVCVSGNTDCYQPAERTLKLTRRCLEVFREFGNPIGVITKNALVARDADVLAAMAEKDLAEVTITVTTLDPELARKLEPRASTPSRRLAAVRALADAGVPVNVNVAPVVPGLTDDEIPALLAAAKAHGARTVGWTMLRLPLAVEPLFLDWLKREVPLKERKVLARLRDLRGGKLTEAGWGVRMRGRGPYAELIRALFETTCRRLGFAERPRDLDAPEARAADARAKRAREARATPRRRPLPPTPEETQGSLF